MTAPAVEAVPHRLGGWTVECPFCRRRHFHGAAALGARVSHCRDVASRQPYVLERSAPGRRSTTKKEK